MALLEGQPGGERLALHQVQALIAGPPPVMSTPMTRPNQDRRLAVVCLNRVAMIKRARRR